jgi:glycosyltransferase involved in cell wall biosynthesis
MKVGFDVSQAIYGTGVSDYTINLVHNLEKLPEVQLVLFGSSLRRKSDLKNLFPNVLAFPYPPTFLHHLWNKVHLLDIEKFIGKVDIFHSSDWTQPPSKSKKVTTVHDLSPLLFPQETSTQILEVFKAKMSWSVKECDKIICVSQSTANDLQTLYKVSSSRISVIPEALPSRLLISPRKKNISPFVLAIGARQPRKNITALVTAFTLYQSKYNLPQTLIIVGEKPDHVITNNPQIIFTGHISDQELVDYLSSASVFVYPSLYEGFGLPILGAFYHKVPVVASNCSSIPEVTGRAAILVDPKNMDSIASGISQALKDKNKLITKGTDRLKRFSWDKTTALTLDIYKSLCS